MVVPRAWRGVRGSVSGGRGPLSVAQAAPPLPLPPPQTLLMKSSWPHSGGGRQEGEEGGGRREEAGAEEGGRRRQPEQPGTRSRSTWREHPGLCVEELVSSGAPSSVWRACGCPGVQGPGTAGTSGGVLGLYEFGGVVDALCVCVIWAQGLRMRVAGCVCTSVCPVCRAGPAVVCVVVALLLGNVFLGNGHWGGQWAGCVDGFVPTCQGLHTCTWCQRSSLLYVCVLSPCTHACALCDSRVSGCCVSLLLRACVL